MKTYTQALLKQFKEHNLATNKIVVESYWNHIPILSYEEGQYNGSHYIGKHALTALMHVELRRKYNQNFQAKFGYEDPKLSLKMRLVHLLYSSVFNFDYIINNTNYFNGQMTTEIAIKELKEFYKVIRI